MAPAYGVIRSLARGFTRRKIFPGLIYRNFFHFGESDFAHNTKKVMTKQSPNTALRSSKTSSNRRAWKCGAEIGA
jgi:hypothetical protein